MKHINQIVFLFSLFSTCLSHATWTDLHRAVFNGNFERVRVLLDAGADVNAADKYKETPLNVAEKFSHTEVARLLRRWPKYQNLLEERKAEMIAFLMATHPRIGADSLANDLPRELFKYIWEFVKPTIKEADNFRGNNEVQSNRTWLKNTWLQRGAVTTAIAGLGVLEYQLFKRR